MSGLVSAPILLPVAAAGGSLLLGRRIPLRRALTIVVLVAVLIAAGTLLVLADRGGPLVSTAGGWAAPLGIALVADRLSGLLLVVSVGVALAVLVFAIGQGAVDGLDALAVVFHPAYLLLVAGTALAFLSGDLFTLFVAFELVLTASYVLITLGARRGRSRAAMTYVITGLTSSLLFLTAVGLVYASAGTVNLADLSGRLAGIDPRVVTALSLLLLVVFGIKAAVVPLHFWLPDSYPNAPAPITAALAAILTKVGVYALVRTQTLLFPREDVWWLLAGAAVVTMLVGILGAIAQRDLNRLLSFTLVSHIGFMLFGLALADRAGLTGTILYTVHHIVVQAALFLVAGLVVRHTGTARLDRMGGLAGTAPVVAVLLGIPALSLSGVPPFSGFVAKLALLDAGVRAGGAAVALAGAAVLTSLLTLYAMARVWLAVCWGGPRPPVPDADRGDDLDVGTGARSPLMTASTAAVVAAGVAVAVFAGPLSALSQRAATDLLAPQEYRGAVLDREER